jgi:hypothetical protein
LFTLVDYREGMGYEDLLTSVEMADLLRLFQQRHLLAHCEGIVDQDYIIKSGDTTYAVGYASPQSEEVPANAGT